MELHELHDWITTLEQRIVELNDELDELRQLLERRQPGNSVYTALAAQIALFQEDLAATQVLTTIFGGEIVHDTGVLS